MNAFPRLSAWLGLGPAPAEPPPSAASAAAAPPAEETSTPMEVEEEATAAAAAAWLSPELATAATPPTPASSAAAAAPFSPSFATERPQRPRRRPSPVTMPAPALAAPTLAEEPPSRPAPVELPDTPVEQVEKMVIETPKPRRKPVAPPPPKLEEALRQKLAEALGDDATSYINSFRRCGRCGKACDATKCMVEHPAHLRRDRGATFSFSSYESLYACGVCGAEFKEVVDAKNGVISSSKFVGDLVCFCGVHAPQCLKKDPQRIHERAVTLSRAHDLQEHLDNVPDDVEILTVTWGATRPVSVSFQPDGLRFLRLRVLSLQTLEGFRTVYLDQVTVPALQDLTLQHKSRSCWVHLDLPQVRNLYLRSWEGEADCVRSLLAEAVDLETFAARCLPAEDLRFCSDCLREVTVNRCEALRTLILDAPYLTHLRVDHCFNLDTIEFLHPCSEGEPLKVSSRGSYLGGTARRNLRAHPRSVRADDDQDAARSVFPLASYAHEDHSGQAARALNGRSSGCKAWWDAESDGESDVGDSDDEDEPEAVRDFRRMMAFVAQRAGDGED